MIPRRPRTVRVPVSAQVAAMAVGLMQGCGGSKPGDPRHRKAHMKGLVRYPKRADAGLRKF